MVLQEPALPSFSISCFLCSPCDSHDRHRFVPRICQPCCENKTFALALPCACTLVVDTVAWLASSPLSGFNENGTSLEWSFMTTELNGARVHCTLHYFLHGMEHFLTFCELLIIDQPVGKSSLSVCIVQHCDLSFRNGS